MSEVLLSEVWLSALVALHISCRNSSWGCICASVAMLTGTITLRKVILVDCQRHLVLIQNKNWKQYITIINYQEGFGSIRFGLVSSLQESVRFGSTRCLKGAQNSKSVLAWHSMFRICFGWIRLRCGDVVLRSKHNIIMFYIDICCNSCILQHYIL